MTPEGQTQGLESLRDVHLRIPASIHDELKLAAAIQRVPLSNLLRMILRGWVMEKSRAA